MSMADENEKLDPPLEMLYAHQIAASHTDALTGLVNHGFFFMALERDIKRFVRHGTAFAVGMINIDSFKLYNKAHGRLESDRTLQEIAQCIRENIRKADLAARYGDDVFAVIFSETEAIHAMGVIERIRFGIKGLDKSDLTVSIGVSDSSSADSAEGIVEKACEALKQARIRGGDCDEIYGKPQKTAVNSSARVLIVDDTPLNLKLLEATLRTQKYEVIQADSGMMALDILNKIDVDLILLDVMMPEMDGFETCRRIKGLGKTRLIPVILITGLNDHESKVKGIEAGADDFITKPPNLSELIARTKSLIRLRQLNRNLASIENVLFSMAKAVEAKDKYTQGHIERVAHLSTAIGQKMELNTEEIAAMKYGGILHDIGKIGIPNEILNKPGKLTPEERGIMETHSMIGYRIGLPLQENLGLALQVIRYHHEKLDGSGYPDGLKGEEIPIVAKIVGVVDIYDALITDRPYRKGMPKEKAFSILTEEAAAGKIDQTIVEILISYCN
jgi:putative two-component system response regulator